jgi:hypothetical protein
MCAHRPSTAAHWRLARRLSSRFDHDHPGADARIDAIAARIRAELDAGADAPRATARAALEALRLLPDSACTSMSRLLPAGAASSGTGHELACTIALMEAARRAGAEVHLAASDDSLALLVGDERGWGAVVPRLGAIDWVPMPIAAAVDDSFGACCAHDASRMLVALLAPVLPSEQLPAAMAIVDDLTAA